MVQTGSVLQDFPVLESTELSLFCGHMSDLCSWGFLPILIRCW
jgi:hypothetical protein